MPYTATHRFARIAPRKARLVMDLVRGRDVDDALALLSFNRKRVAIMIDKVIRSAVANAAEQGEARAQGTFFVAEARVNGGPVIKRFMPKDRGKAYDIKKRTSHLVVTIDEREGGADAQSAAAEEKAVKTAKRTRKSTKKAEAAA